MKGMKHVVSAFLAALLMATVPSGPAVAADPLADLQWKNRILLMFAKSRSDASLDKQVDVLREVRPELRERDLIVLRTAGNEETRAAIGYTSLNNGAARQLRQRFKPESSRLTIILVGKDGQEKQRWNRVVEPEEIFKIIDAMPMRQQEAGESETDS
ncbi:DUF4174 domain-containing protein [Ahrensia sp. R2A130]|uniref:DUF4174 domain-containing protein n=1 Tax=Ahrensia sp. R2A130 TaxID=744979 RepID=UPI0001E0A470|nr:DUF4174 domain-containing protein [Ahrensia sp. R2A130]EFL89658.1 conserved hypothetical protein [Ahrensia sp. R2A130]